MNLQLAPEEEGFRLEVRSWVKSNLPDHLARRVRHALKLSKEDMQLWHTTLGRKGWLCYGWSKQDGGPGWSAVRKHLFEEECAAANAPRIQPFGVVYVGPILLAYASEQQKARFLPGIRSGEVWWSQGYSEPGAGSDLASLKTRAERVGDHYVVNGQKIWTSKAHYGDWIFCLVRTSSEGKPQAGISFLLIDMRSPGLSVRPIITIDGEHNLNEVFFDNVEVPVENLVGEENKGWTYAKHLLAHERVNISDVSRAKRELERLKRIAKTQGCWNNLAFRDEIAKLEADTVALELLVLRVLSAMSVDRSDDDIVGLLKVCGSEITQRCSELQMLAAGEFALPHIPEAECDGWGGEFPGGNVENATLLPSYFINRKTTIYAGSNEVQRNIISKRLLG